MEITQPGLPDSGVHKEWQGASQHLVLIFLCELYPEI